MESFKGHQNELFFVKRKVSKEVLLRRRCHGALRAGHKGRGGDAGSPTVTKNLFYPTLL